MSDMAILQRLSHLQTFQSRIVIMACPKRLMRKAWLILLFALIAITFVGVAGAVYTRHDNGVRVERAEALVRDLQQLAIGKSNYHAAEAIANRYGIAPPPYWTPVYPKEDCAAGHFEDCGYSIEMNNGPLHSWVLRHPLLRHLAFVSGGEAL